MKKSMVFKLCLLLVSAPCILRSYAQDSPLWGLPEGAKARFGKGSIREIQYSPDGTRLAVASSIGIWLYDTATHQEVALLTGHKDAVLSVAFSPDGRTIASGSGSLDKTIRLWDADTGNHLRTLTEHTGYVESVAFSPDGRIIASVGDDLRINQWNAHTGKILAGLGGRAFFGSVAFSPDGDTIVKWELGQHHPSVENRYDKTPESAPRAFGCGHKRSVQSQRRHYCKRELGQHHPSMGRR